MCYEDKLRIVHLIARSLYDHSIEHGLPHVERVSSWAFKIREAERLDIDHMLLQTAVILHDVGRLVGEPHAYYSSIIADMLLREAGCDDSFINEVRSAIEYHSFSYRRVSNRRSIVGEVLSDADKLDALGLIGFLRVFIYGDRRGRSLEESLRHFNEKILKLPRLMHFNYSYMIAKQYMERVKHLIKILCEELGLDYDSYVSRDETKAETSEAHSKL